MRMRSFRNHDLVARSASPGVSQVGCVGTVSTCIFSIQLSAKFSTMRPEVKNLPYVP